MNFNNENDTPVGIGKNTVANPESKKQENPNRIPQTVSVKSIRNTQCKNSD